jgi:hypothetical protein
LILIIVYTASRPGALIYVARNKKKSRGYVIGENNEDKDEDENKNIIKNPVKKIASIITGITSRLKHYTIKTLRCFNCLIRIVFETY